MDGAGGGRAPGGEDSGFWADAPALFFMSVTDADAFVCVQHYVQVSLSVFFGCSTNAFDMFHDRVEETTFAGGHSVKQVY
jgi:hypothetical protein